MFKINGRECMPIDYKLAKELKEAGFPQNTESKFCKNTNDKEWSPFNKVEQSDYCFPGFLEGPAEPTLSELIEALPKNQNLQLFGQEGGWSATTGNLSGLIEVAGATPEEVVAKLWG